MRSIAAFFRKHPVILLVICILITAVTVYHRFVFDGYLLLFDDVGADMKQLYVMQYNSIVNHLRDLDFSLWDSTNGFGTSIYQYTLFNPLLWVLYLAGLIFGNAAIGRGIVWIIILAMVLSGVFVWHFLSCFTFSAKAKFIAAYIYSFNGFLTVWGQHFAFLAIMALMPLVLMTLEKAMRKNRFSPAAAICIGLTVLTTYYMSYMFLLIAALYAVVRIWTLRPEGVGAYFSNLFKQAAAALLGVGIGMLNLLPSAGIVFNVSSRLQDETGLFEKIIQALSPWPKAYYETLAERFLSGGLQGNSSVQTYTGYYNYYEAPNVFFTSLFVFLFVQFLIYLIVKKYDKRLRAASVFAVIIGAFMLLIPAGSLPFNFFMYEFSRHTFLLMPFFALMTAFMLDKLIRERFLNAAGLVLTLILCLFVYYHAFREAYAVRVGLLAIFLAVLTCILAACLLVYAKTRKQCFRLLYSAIFLAVAGQAFLDLYSTVYMRVGVDSSGTYFEDLYGEDCTALAAWLEENEPQVYRIERDFTTASWTMDTLALGYDGVSSYNTTMNSNILDMLNEMLPEMVIFDSGHISFRQIINQEQLHSLFGIKYIVSKNPEIEYGGYELAGTFGELYLYENTNWKGFATFYTDTISESDYEEIHDSETVDVAALAAEYIILQDEDVSETSSDADGARDFTKVPTDEYKIDESVIDENNAVSTDDDYIYIPFNKEIESGRTVSVTFNADTEADFTLYIKTSENGTDYTAVVSEGETETVTLILPEGTKGLYLSIGYHYRLATATFYNFEFYTSENTEHTQSAVIETADIGKDGYYSADVTSDEDGYLLMPIPYEDGWTVTVDGQITEALKADYGFVAVPLAAGKHTVEFTYEQPYLKLSLYITLCSLAVCLAAMILTRRKVRGQIT